MGGRRSITAVEAWKHAEPQHARSCPAQQCGTRDTIETSKEDYDVILIADVPDEAAMAAASINACSTGLVRIKTTPLLTIAETDQALGEKVEYQAPGR